MKKENEEFVLTNLPPEARDESISKDDFKLVQKDAVITDQKFETKPTTFFRDSLRRFRKNKSSVVAAFILGFLLLLSFIIPLFTGFGRAGVVHVTDGSRPELQYLQPRLFKPGTGFWDGTKKLTDIVVDTSDPNPDNWGPDSNIYSRNAVSDLVIGEETYTSTVNKYVKDGYVQFGYFYNIPDNVEYISYSTYNTKEEYVLDHELKVNNFVTYDLAKLQASDEKKKEFPEGYVEAKSALYFTFTEGGTTYPLALTTYELAHDVGGSEEIIDVKAKFDDFIAEKGLTNTIINPRFEIRVENAKNYANSCTLIKSISISSGALDEEDKALFEDCSFKNGKEACMRNADSSGYWKNDSSITYSKDTNYLLKAHLCSFTYDTYEAVLGTVEQLLFKTQLETMVKNGEIKLENYQNGVRDPITNKWVAKSNFKCTILDPENCALSHNIEAKDLEFYEDTGLIKGANCELLKYKLEPYNLDKMPIFLLGTDEKGNDMLLLVFRGLRNSLLLGIITSAVCFLFGLFWGSVSGYFGGAVDLAMERLTDILSGVPWIVVMTLTIIHLGSNFFTFVLALCLTGWIGTAATTRTQFYRFRGREYVLASRTLGASHGRLIAKHILPNAMGTIITSAVLMVPSVIFSEATISFLGLGFQNMASLGVVLSEKQAQLTNHPYLLIFPSVIIALIMISFNLFGNGLRDAVNPSLKGEDE